MFIGPIISGIKILVSRSTEIATNQQLDKPLVDLDPEFVDTSAKFLQNLPKMKTIKPFPKELVPEGNKIIGIHAMSDGGVPGYSSIIYITSESMTKVLTSRVCGTKERVS